jgi:hypothetical protein
MTKWKRRFIWSGALLGALVAALLLYAWFFGAQTFFAFETRYMARKLPIVKSVPVELEDKTVSAARGKKLSFQGAEFEVPWEDLDEQRTRVVRNMVAIYFRSGRSILLCVGAPDGFITGLSKDKNVDPNVFATLYGPQVLHSNYALFDDLYQTTPSEITLATPSNRAAGLTAVLMVKAIVPPTTDWAIFRVQSKTVKGFQLGDPVRGPKRMCLQLFVDDAEFEVSIFQDGKGSDPTITQAEINRIIQTTHKATDTQPILRVSPA